MRESSDDSAKKEWMSLLANLVKYGGPHGTLLAERDYQKGVEQVVQTIQVQEASLVDVVRLLGGYLVTEDDVPRSRAISFLAEMIVLAPLIVDRKEDVHYLADFFSSRLMDWPALHGALQGCHSIIMTDRVEENDAVSMLQTLNDGVYVRSLSVRDRSLALCMIQKIVEKYGQGVLDADIDLTELIIVSIDGEKDPLCLMDGFKAAQMVLQTFESLGEQSVHQSMLEAASEEMFDILSCYFPVSFTPPEHDKSITREDIAEALEVTLLAWRGFHSSVLDLVEEKISSIVKQAKKDSIHMLRSLAGRNGEIIAKESRRIWNMLRPELMMALLDGKDYPPLFQSAEDLGIGGDALLCLSKCLHACNGHENQTMASTVLSDVSLSDALTCLKAVGDEEDAFSRSVGSVRASSVIFQASARAGGEACSMCIEQYGGAILDIADTTESIESACFAYILMYSMLLDAGFLYPCKVSGKSLEIAQGILLKCLILDNHLGMCRAEDSLLWLKNNQLAWSREKSAYNHVTTMMTKIRLCQMLVINECFEAIWNPERVDTLVDGCISAIISQQGDQAFISGMNDVLYSMCTSRTGKSHRIGNKLVKPLLQSLESKACTENLADCIFTIIAPICRDDASVGSEVFAYIIQGLSDNSSNDRAKWEHLVKGLVVLETYFSDNPESSPEEVRVLRVLLSASCQSLLCSTEQVRGIVNASYQISRRVSQQDQQKLIDSSISSSLSSWHTVSYFASLGCFLGLCKDAIESISIDHKTLLDVCFDLLIQSEDENDFEWLSIVVASVMNKICPEQVHLVHDRITELSRLALEPNDHDETKDWWKSIGVCIRALAKQGDVVEIALDKMCLAMYTIETCRSKVYFLLHSLLNTDQDEQWIAKNSHSSVSFLWYQKAYIIAKKCVQAHVSTIEDGSMTMKTALIHLISGAPTAIIQNDCGFVSEQLFEFLSNTSCIEEIISDKVVLEKVLTVFKSLVCTSEKSRKQIEDHLSSILPSLLFIARNSQFGNTRRTALECLDSLATYIPYRSLHCFRHDVLKTAMAACDDNKRHVRLAAAQCRGTWSR